MKFTAQSRLGQADAAKYAYGDEWYTFDEAALLTKPASELIALEQAMDGYTIGQLISGMGQRSTQAMRAALWIARKLAHDDIEKFSAFDPSPWQTLTRLVDENGDEVKLKVGDDGLIVLDEPAEPAEGGDADPLEDGHPAKQASPAGS